MNTTSKQRKPNTLAATIVWTASVLMALALSVSVQARAQDATRNHSAQSQETVTPKTAQEHRDIAKQYQEKADAYRKEAETHKKMLEEYSKTVARNPKDTGENAYIKKMRVHCQKYVRAAESLAQEADEMAKYHLM